MDRTTIHRGADFDEDEDIYKRGSNRNFGTLASKQQKIEAVREEVKYPQEQPMQAFNLM